MPELPPELAPLINLLGFVCAAIFVGWSYAKKLIHPSEEKKPSLEAQIVGGALADRAAMTELARSIDELNETIRASVTVLREANALRERQQRADEIEDMIIRKMGRPHHE